MLSVYIAGPMSGLPDHNFPAFHRAAALWRDAGWNAVNPAELDVAPFEEDWKYYLRRDIKLLVDCDAIAAMPGSLESRGARLELTVAAAFDMPLFDAFHPARYEAHDFVEPGNICCMRPDYVHEKTWAPTTRPA